MVNKKTKRPRVHPHEIARAMIQYVQEVERGDKDAKWWAETTGFTTKDLSRWKQPSRQYIRYAKAIIDGRMEIEDIPIGGNRSKDAAKALREKLKQNKGVKLTDEERAAMAQRAATNIAIVKSNANAMAHVQDTTIVDPDAAPESPDLNGVYAEIASLRAQVNEMKSSLDHASEQIEAQDEHKAKLHRYLGMMTEAQIDNSLKS